MFVPDQMSPRPDPCVRLLSALMTSVIEMALQSWQGVTLDGVVDFLGDRRTEYDGSGSLRVSLPWDLTADQYLGFARSDLRQPSTRGRVNAVGNAKRALHCQVDSVLYATGFWPRAEEKRWPFPVKADLLTEMKIAAPNVLRRINRLRNEIEHDYSVPADLDRLQDFLDVVELFISNTRSSASSSYEDASFVRRTRRGELYAVIEFRSGDLEVRLLDSSGSRVLRANGHSRFRRLQVAVYNAAWREKVSLAR